MKQADKIDKIYFAIFGMNGKDGLLRQQNKMEDKMDAYFKKLDDFLLTRKLTCPVALDRKLTAGKVVTYVLMAATWATLILKLLGVI